MSINDRSSSGGRHWVPGTAKDRSLGSMPSHELVLAVGKEELAGRLKGGIPSGNIRFIHPIAGAVSQGRFRELKHAAQERGDTTVFPLSSELAVEVRIRRMVGLPALPNESAASPVLNAAEILRNDVRQAVGDYAEALVCWQEVQEALAAKALECEELERRCRASEEGARVSRAECAAAVAQRDELARSVERMREEERVLRLAKDAAEGRAEDAQVQIAGLEARIAEIGRDIEAAKQQAIEEGRANFADELAKFAADSRRGAKADEYREALKDAKRRIRQLERRVDRLKGRSEEKVVVAGKSPQRPRVVESPKLVKVKTRQAKPKMTPPKFEKIGQLADWLLSQDRLGPKTLKRFARKQGLKFKPTGIAQIISNAKGRAKMNRPKS